MSIFFTSDTHFGHKGILSDKLEARPFASVEQMDAALIDLWNQRVKKDDTIYHLGDFAFAKPARIVEILGQLHGRKYFITGNHDKELLRALRDVTTRVAVGVVELVPYKEIRIDSQKLVLFHYAQRVWNKSHSGSYHLYGHSHGNLKNETYDRFSRSMDVGVDAVAKMLSKSGDPENHPTFSYNYRPVSFEEVNAILSAREWHQWHAGDHHNGERE